MAVDPLETRRQRVLDAFADGASRTWTRGNGQNRISVTVANVQIREVAGVRVLSAEVTLTRGGTVWFDDVINMPNPAVAVVTAPGDPLAVPPVPPTLTDNPLGAIRQQLEDTITASTRGFTRVWNQRISGSRFRGDTLSVRAADTDGLLLAEGDEDEWDDVQSGSVGVSVNTTATTAAITAKLQSLDYDISIYACGWDTSSIPDAATIDDVTASFYGTGTAEQNANTTTIELRGQDWSGGGLTSADWVNFVTATNWTNLPYIGSMALGSWNQTNNTANALTAQAGAVGWVSKTGISYAKMILARAYGSAPTGNNTLTTYTANQTGTTSDPLLVVNYTSAVTGTISATAQKATFSGTAAHAQIGIISGEVQEATFSGTAAQTQSGAIEAVVQAVTMAATGAMFPSGELTAEVQAALFNATGEQSGGAIGAIAAALTAATFAASGTHSQSGIITSAVQAVTAAITAKQIYSGVMAGELQPALFSGLATHSQSGIMAAAVQELLFAAIGVMHPSGIIAATTSPALFSGSGKQLFTGALAATLQEATASLTGVMVPSGAIVVSLPAATFTASGLHTQTGILAAAVQAVTFAALGRKHFPAIGRGRYAPQGIGIGRYAPIGIGRGRYATVSIGAAVYNVVAVGSGRYALVATGLGTYRPTAIGAGRG